MEMMFEAALSHVVSPGIEGGFSNHPADRGGATNRGITRETLRRWRNAPVSVEDLRKLTVEETRLIYHSWYWNSVRAAELPAGVDLFIFDMSVNHGQGRAITILQKSVGAEPDGLFGPKTLMMALTQNPGLTIDKMCSFRRAFYRLIVKNDPSQEEFINGWMNRVGATRKAAMKLIG